MLKINLLPDAARKAGLSSVEQFHRAPIMWITVAAMVGVPLLFLASIGISQGQLGGLNAKIAVLTPKKLEVDRIQALLRDLRTQETAFRRLKKGQSLWSKRLNILSDLTPEGVWFTELSLEPAKGLVIQGSAIGQGGSEMVSVGRLVQELKDDPDFASAVKEIQIESIKRVQEKEVEVVRFTLTCALREGPRSP